MQVMAYLLSFFNTVQEQLLRRPVAEPVDGPDAARTGSGSFESEPEGDECPAQAKGAGRHLKRDARGNCAGSCSVITTRRLCSTLLAAFILGLVCLLSRQGTPQSCITRGRPDAWTGSTDFVIHAL